jgi:hypothetical protein
MLEKEGIIIKFVFALTGTVMEKGTLDFFYRPKVSSNQNAPQANNI